VSWSRKFDEQISDGLGRVALWDSADYVTSLPKKASDLPERQAAIKALMLVADLGGPSMFVRIGVMRALNRNVERVSDPSRKTTHWGKRKLKRDQ
jgi:hypothetical protein